MVVAAIPARADLHALCACPSSRLYAYACSCSCCCSYFLMLQAGGRRSVKQQAQAFTSGQSRSRPDSGTVEGCARQPRCTTTSLCAFDATALQLLKERRRPAVAQGAAAHGHARHFGKPPFRSACCLAALFLPSHPAWRIGRRPRQSPWSVERRLTWASRKIPDSAPFRSTMGAPPWCGVPCPAPLDCAGNRCPTLLVCRRN